MKSSAEKPQIYDAYYFQHCCGRPYEPTPEWLQFFDHIARDVTTKIAPATVLDMGCAMGFLVEAFRNRKVEAYGIDLSEYAIQNVQESVRPFCRLGSALDPLPQTYDLVMCIEVLEHLPARQAPRAVENLCSIAEDIVFSSTPDDYGEATHFNVQPPEYWAELFALHGFFRDTEYDASVITPWAARFRKSREPLHRLIRKYENSLWLLTKENVRLRETNLAQQEQLKNREAF